MKCKFTVMFRYPLYFYLNECKAQRIAFTTQRFDTPVSYLHQADVRSQRGVVASYILEG